MSGVGGRWEVCCSEGGMSENCGGVRVGGWEVCWSEGGRLEVWRSEGGI